jgi:antitoxin component YwqK of YwqJK toxin-antitoxin module
MPHRRRAPLLLALPLLLAAAGCQRRVSADRVVEREGVVFLPGDQRPFSGTVFERHSNGRPKQEMPYRDGRKHGTLRRWYADGALAYSCEYASGARAGRAQSFHPSGTRTLLAEFRGDHLEGPYQEWFETGARKLECTYRAGEPDGVWHEWHANGGARLVATYRNGALAGELRAWHADGTLRLHCGYLEGWAHGECRQWFAGGSPEWRAVFANGVLDGELTFWHANGQRRFKAAARGEAPYGEWQKWHQNGAVRQRGTWRDGQLDGVWEEWDERGQRLERADYRGGERVTLRQWYASGRPRFEATRGPGSAGWTWRAWRRDGREQRESPLLRGLYPFLFGSQKDAGRTGAGPAPNLTETQRRSLESLSKVPDRPLEVMRYFGDYGFAERLVRGLPGRWYCLPSFSDALMPTAERCSTFVTSNRAGQTIFAYNNDLKQDPQLLLYTAPPDAYASVSVVIVPSMLDPEGDAELARWNGERLYLRAPYNPIVGMNERGVAVSGMSSESQEPALDPRRPTLPYAQMLRLVLDYAANVEEAVELVRAYNWQHWHDHLLIADRTGRSVVLEYLGDQVVEVLAQGRWQVSTNFRLSGRSEETWSGRCWRYDRASATLKEHAGDLDADAALGLLSSISMMTPLETASSTVFNLTTGDGVLAVHRDYSRPYRFHLPTR